MAEAKCNPTVSLPEYILDRNRAALAAGLTIERQDIERGSLTTWYRGTETQWKGSPFCQRTGAFTRARMLEFSCFSPAPLWTFSVNPRPDRGDYRGSMPREPLPERIEQLGDGIAVYTMRANPKICNWLNIDSDCERYSVYVGVGQALVDWKIAPAEILINRDLHVKTARGGSYTVWEREVLPDGRYAFFDFGMPNDDKIKLRQSFGAASQLTTKWAQFAQNVLAIGEEEYARARGPDGKRFSVAPDSLATIRELAEELIDAIRCADVVEREARPAKIVQPPWRSRAAHADVGFQDLLKRVSSGMPAKD
jgi:hypothetical protein